MSVVATLHRICAALILVLALSQSKTLVRADSNAPAQPPSNLDEWTGWGGNIYNNRWAYKDNNSLNSSNIAQVVQNCKLDYEVGVSATPVVVNWTAYYPTGNGSFYALNIATCQYEWQVNVTQLIYNFQTPSAFVLNYSLPMSRTSPQIDTANGVVYFGTQALALLAAVDLHTGQTLAVTQVNPHPMAVLTMSPTLYNGTLFIGASSHEDAAAALPGYKCCDFIGNFAAYTFSRSGSSGKFTRSWEVDTLPSGQGWAGAGVWGSQPSIDPVRNQVFIGTGNLLTVPTSYLKCSKQPPSCLPDNIWQDSVVALDIATGNKKWRVSTTPLDDWNQACGYPGDPKSQSPLCPDGVGPDADFGMAPTFVPASLGSGTTGTDSVVVGQKSGNLFNLNAATGAIQWNFTVGNDDSGNWLSWGVAVDASRIYYTGINYGNKNYTLSLPSGAGPTINNSAWAAADLKTGKPDWAMQVPGNELAYSPPSIVSDIVIVGQSGSSTANVSGAVFALSASTGAVVYQIPVQGVQNSGFAIKNGFLLFGTGYAYRNPFNTGSFYVYATRGAIADAIADIAANAAHNNGSSSTTGSGTASASGAAKSGGAKASAGVPDARLEWTSLALALAGLAAGFVWLG